MFRDLRHASRARVDRQTGGLARLRRSTNARRRRWTRRSIARVLPRPRREGFTSRIPSRFGCHPSSSQVSFPWRLPWGILASKATDPSEVARLDLQQTAFPEAGVTRSSISCGRSSQKDDPRAPPPSVSLKTEIWVLGITEVLQPRLAQLLVWKNHDHRTPFHTACAAVPPSPINREGTAVVWCFSDRIAALWPFRDN